MNKFLISSCGAVALFLSSVTMADTMDNNTMNPNTTPGIMPTSTNDQVTEVVSQTKVQLKTADGKVIHATIDTDDFKNLKNGDQLEVMTVDESSPSTMDPTIPPSSEVNTPTTDMGNQTTSDQMQSQ